MTTARDIVNLAFKQAGILGLGQTLNAEDTNDGFTLLNQMVAQWQKRRWLVPSLQILNKTLTGQKSYTVGLGGFFDIKRPSDIKGAYVIQKNTGPVPVSLQLTKLFSYEDYIRIAVKDLQSLPDHFFYDAQYPLANLYIWPVGNSLYELYILCQSQLGFGTTISQGAISSGGTLYTDGIYNNILLTGGSGTGATADITVTAGVVTLFNLLTGGQNYNIGDILSVNNADIGGTGAGFAYVVQNISANLNTDVVMPPEYEEALFLNLSIRLSAMYQLEPTSATVVLAKKSLNTLKTINTQVPQLSMPQAPGLRTGKAFNIWNADGY